MLCFFYKVRTFFWILQNNWRNSTDQNKKKLFWWQNLIHQIIFHSLITFFFILKDTVYYSSDTPEENMSIGHAWWTKIRPSGTPNERKFGLMTNVLFWWPTDFFFYPMSVFSVKFIQNYDFITSNLELWRLTYCCVMVTPFFLSSLW